MRGTCRPVSRPRFTPSPNLRGIHIDGSDEIGSGDERNLLRQHLIHQLTVEQLGKLYSVHASTISRRVAKAREVLLASGRRWALMHELRDEPEPPLEALLARLSPVDIALVEGFKASLHDKIEAHRGVTGHPLIAPGDPTVRAVASDTPLHGLACPVLDLDDIAAIADFIVQATGLGGTP